jgi:hypothetical protein
MVQWVHRKLHYFAFAPPGRAHAALASICHNYLDFMIVWVNIFLHLSAPLAKNSAMRNHAGKIFINLEV